jgi:hypothetical protein
MKAHLHAAAILAVLAVAAPPQTEPSDCASATEHHKETVEAVTSAAQKYQACVAASNAHDHCAAEMQALDSAHDDFDDTISEIEKTCTAK